MEALDCSFSDEQGDVADGARADQLPDGGSSRQSEEDGMEWWLDGCQENSMIGGTKGDGDAREQVARERIRSEEKVEVETGASSTKSRREERRDPWRRQLLWWLKQIYEDWEVIEVFEVIQSIGSRRIYERWKK